MAVVEWILSVVFSGFLVAAALLITMRGQHVYHRRTYFFFILGMIAVVGVMQLVSNYTDYYADSLLKKLCYIFGLNVVQAGIAIGVLLVGGWAYIFKQKKQYWYGLCEVVFGLAGAFHVAQGMSPDEPLKNGGWWLLGGCMYIIQRGFNNISDAGKPPCNQVPSSAASASGVQL